MPLNDAGAVSLLVPVLIGLSQGLLLFMLAAGLTLVYSLMGVLNFAHASFYMLGAYFCVALGRWIGPWWALMLAPVLVAAIGALVDRLGLRRARDSGHLAEMLFTFGVAWVLQELVQLVWGRQPLAQDLPELLQGTLFRIDGIAFPVHRAFVIAIALAMLAVLWWLSARTRAGLVMRAAMTHPRALQALGHDVPAWGTVLFALGCGLAGLAGAVGGQVFVTEPTMGAQLGAIVFVIIIIGGPGSVIGALVASLIIAVMQSLALQVDLSVDVPGAGAVSIARVAPLLPYVLMIAVLLVHPRGLMGRGSSVARH